MEALADTMPQSPRHGPFADTDTLSLGSAGLTDLLSQH